LTRACASVECVVGLLVLVAPQLRADPHEDRAEHRGQHAAAHEPEPDHPHALDQELQHDAADHGDDAEHEQREPRHASAAARRLDAAQRLGGRRAQALMLLGLAEELRVEFGLLTQQLQALRGQLREAHLQVLDLLGHVALRRERVAQLEDLMPQHGILHEQLAQFRGMRDADVGILGGEALVGDQFATLAIDRLALTVELLAAMRVRMIERAHGLVVTREQIAQVTLGARGDRGAGGQFGGLDLESCDLGERLVLLGDPLAQRARVPGATLDLERAQVLLQLLLLLPQLLQLIDRRLDLEQSRIELTQTDLALGALGLEPHECVVERAREADLGASYSRSAPSSTRSASDALVSPMCESAAFSSRLLSVEPRRAFSSPGTTVSSSPCASQAHFSNSARSSPRRRLPIGYSSRPSRKVEVTSRPVRSNTATTPRSKSRAMR
jgi:hypothetical protein